MTEAGTATEEFVLARLTTNPLLAAAVFNVTEHASVPEPVMDEVAQETADSTGTPAPLRLTVVGAFVEELLAIVNVPLAAPAAVGSNCTLSVAVWPELSVSGKVRPEIEKPVPASVAEFMVTATLPVEESVIDCEVGVLTATFPKLRVELLTASVGMAAFNCRVKDGSETPATADSVAA